MPKKKEEIRAKLPGIYHMNDFDTVIAYSKKQAVEFYFDYDPGNYNSIDEIDEECKHELDLEKGFWFIVGEKELFKEIETLDEYDEIKIGRWNGDLARWTTFKEAIEKYLDRIDIPGIICSTEY